LTDKTYQPKPRKPSPWLSPDGRGNRRGGSAPLAPWERRAYNFCQSTRESGVLTNEQELSKANDLRYINLPLASNASNEEKVDPLLTAITDLPTPIYFYCGGGGRAAVTALIALAVQGNWGKEAIEVKVIESGIDPAHPQIHHYLTKLKQSSEPA
jgi:protein tyrosine phosphatase (PTP) superfamily phosphohydrolase (DUF442 family)